MTVEKVLHFSTIDYIVFAIMLLASAGIGIFYMVRRLMRRRMPIDAIQFLTIRKMHPANVIMSLIASYVSGITMLGSPAEIYFYGTQYSLIAIAIILSGIFIHFVHLPLFYELNLSSSYQYLELRFNKNVRRLASIFFIIDELLFLPVLIYTPAVAFNQVSGINTHIISTVVTLICISYTLMGGLEAILWADTLQIIIMFCAVIIVMIVATVQVGGPGNVWDLSSKGGRLIFDNFSWSPFEKHSVFLVIFGGFSYWMCFNSCHQTMVQKYTAVSSLRKAKISFDGFLIGVTIFVFMCCYLGLLIYATYADCDPYFTKRIHEMDQIVALFVMEKTEHIYGLPGLFIAGVFGAAMSTLAIVLNATTLVIYESFVKGHLKQHVEEKFGYYISKSITFGLGIISILSIFLIEHMGGILSLTVSLSSIAASVNSGMFLLGMIFPWANAKGAFAGAIAGGLISSVLALGQGTMIRTGNFQWPALPVRVDGCGAPWNISIHKDSPLTDTEPEPNVFPLFRLSMHLISPIGLSTVLIVGLIVTFASKANDLSTLDPKLIAVTSRWLLPKPEEDQCTKNDDETKKTTKRVWKLNY